MKSIMGQKCLLCLSTNQAEAFASYLKTKVEKVVEENQINPHVINETRIVECSNHNFFTLDLVHSIMVDHKKKPCFGSDRIPMKVLKDGVDFLAKPILRLMNLIFEQNRVPGQWKIFRITPLCKKGPRASQVKLPPMQGLLIKFDRTDVTRMQTSERVGRVLSKTAFLVQLMRV